MNKAKRLRIMRIGTLSILLLLVFMAEEQRTEKLVLHGRHWVDLSPEWAERLLSWRHTGFSIHSP
jgi:hypothetical protein